MTHGNPVALVGAGVFAHNVCKALEAGGVSVGYFVDEKKSGTYMDRPVLSAAALEPLRIAETARYLVAISLPAYREAAVHRLLTAGVPAERIIPLTDDHILPILNLIFGEFGAEAAAFFTSEACRSIFDLERRFFGGSWKAARLGLDPKKPTIAFCFFGRGGGFRRHLRGLIPRLRDRCNLLALMDEKLPGEGFDIPELYMGPDTASRPDDWGVPEVDLCITAHFLPCTPPDRPKVNFLHTSFDFILEPSWIVDRLETADPHYIFTSTRATYEWMRDLVTRRPLDNRVCLIPGGYTRLDRNLEEAEAYEGPVDSVIYAPTLSLNAVQHHHLTYSAPHAAAMLQALHDALPDQEIVFRPHPNDLALLLAGRDDELARPLLAALELCEELPRLRLDDSKTYYMDSYNRAHVMISDTSSTAYTYALSTLRPVVFFSPRDAEVQEIFSDQSFFIRDRERVGAVAASVPEMVRQVQAMMTEPEVWRERIATYREEVCFHVGHTEEYFVESLESILAQHRKPEWFHLNWDEDAPEGGRP